VSARIRNVNASAGIDKVIAGGRAAFHGSPINTAIPATVIANTSGPQQDNRIPPPADPPQQQSAAQIA